MTSVQFATAFAGGIGAANCYLPPHDYEVSRRGWEVLASRDASFFHTVLPPMEFGRLSGVCSLEDVESLRSDDRHRRRRMRQASVIHA